MPMTMPPMIWLRAVLSLSTRPASITETTRETRMRPRSGARAVMLSETARKLLQGQLEATSVNGSSPTPTTSPVAASTSVACSAGPPHTAGLRDFHFHDLKRHGATMALNAGFTGEIVMALGGWKSGKMMRRYAAVTGQTLRAAAEAISGHEPVSARRRVSNRRSKPPRKPKL